MTDTAPLLGEPSATGAVLAAAFALGVLMAGTGALAWRVGQWRAGSGDLRCAFFSGAGRLDDDCVVSKESVTGRNFFHQAVAECLAILYGVRVLARRGGSEEPIALRLRQTKEAMRRGMGAWLAFVPVLVSLLAISLFLSFWLRLPSPEEGTLRRLFVDARQYPGGVVLLALFIRGGSITPCVPRSQPFASSLLFCE